MRANYIELNENDTVVTMNVEEMIAEIDFVTIRNLYLTPLEALIYAVIRKYASDDENGHKYLKIVVSDFLLAFRMNDIQEVKVAIQRLIEKRLIIEGQSMSQLFESRDGEFISLYSCVTL